MNRGNRKARRAWAAVCRRHMRPGTLTITEIQHDGWCGICSPERVCTCNATRILKDDRGRVLARIEGAGFYDPLEFAEVVR